MPRQRRQVRRYGKQDETVRVSDLETSDSEAEDADENNSNSVASSSQRGGVGLSVKRRRRGVKDKDIEDVVESVPGDGYPRSDCYNVEKNLLVYGSVSPFCHCCSIFFKTLVLLMQV